MFLSKLPILTTKYLTHQQYNVIGSYTNTCVDMGMDAVRLFITGIYVLTLSFNHAITC